MFEKFVNSDTHLTGRPVTSAISMPRGGIHNRLPVDVRKLGPAVEKRAVDI
jgi:hypothetical protein